MKFQKQRKKMTQRAMGSPCTDKPQRFSTLGATIAALMVSPLAAMGQTNDTETQTLKQVEVRAKADDIEINRYNVKVTKVGKVEQDVSDIPQAITIIPDTLMIDQNATTLEEAMRNVPSVTFNSGEGGRIGDNINIRGFYTFGDMYVDGVRDTAQYNRDTFNDAAIEVLRGSASMLFGRGQAGGVINQVSKKAFMDNKSSVSVIGGSFDYFRSTADVNFVIDREQSSAFRINAVVQDSGSSRNHVTNQTQGVAPTYSWGIGTYNQIDASYYYLKTNLVPDYGIGFNSSTHNPVNVPGSTFSGTTADIENNVTQFGTLSQNYSFDKDTSLTTKLRYSNYTRSLWANKGRGQNTSSTDPNVANPYPVQTLSIGGTTRGANEETVAFQSDFNKTLNAWGMGHTIMAGVEYYREHTNRYSYDASGCQPQYSPSNTAWITVNNNQLVKDACTYGYANLVKVPSSVFSYSSNSYAIYGQDMIELTRGVKVMGGLRNDWMNAVYNQPNSTAANRLNNQGLDYSSPSYRAGLLYEPTPTLGTFYLSWSNSFSPTADLYQLSATSGAQTPAETSQLTEIGYKGDINDLGLSFRTSLYHQVKNYERNTDLSSTAALLSTRRHTDGIEFEVTGSLTEKWDVFSGLGLMDSRIDIPANTAATQLIGQTPPNATPYTYNLWTTYQLPYGWKIGGGVNGVGRRNVYSPSAGYSATFTPNWAPAYAQVDGLLQYDAKQYTVRLNAYNLLNTTNYVSLYQNGGFAVPGTYQAFQLGLTYKF